MGRGVPLVGRAPRGLIEPENENREVESCQDVEGSNDGEAAVVGTEDHERKLAPSASRRSMVLIISKRKCCAGF